MRLSQNIKYGNQQIFPYKISNLGLLSVNSWKALLTKAFNIK